MKLKFFLFFVLASTFCWGVFFNSDVTLKYKFVPAETRGQKQCLKNILQKDIELNIKSKAVFAEMSSGRSITLSEKLIRLQRIGKFFSWIFDYPASAYQQYGIPIFCADFEPSEEQSFIPRLSSVSNPPWQSLPVGQISSELWSNWKRAGWPGLEWASIKWSQELSKTPRFACLTRYLIESMGRIAGHVDIYRKMTNVENIFDPDTLASAYIYLSFVLIRLTTNLDAQAVPLQAEGIPIFCEGIPSLLSQ